MAHVRVLILTAVFPEARALARAFALGEVKSVLPLWMKDELALAVVGVRAGLLSKLAEVAELSGVQVVIMAGLAGALSPALAVGDVVVDARDNKAVLPPLGTAFLGRLYTSTGILATVWQKAALFESTHSLAVDMETDIAAAFAARCKAAFLGVRGISDTAEEPLDAALLSLVDPSGRPRIGRAVSMLLRHPGKLRAMLRLRRDASKAMVGVSRTVATLIASGWPENVPDRHAPT